MYVHWQDGCTEECRAWKEGDGRIARDQRGMASVVQSGTSLFEASGWLSRFPGVGA